MPQRFVTRSSALHAGEAAGRALVLPIKINDIENTIEVQVLRNSNFSYDLLLILDAIIKFRLIQDENLEIYQKTKDNKIEKIIYID